jgi:hypothetical protein
MKQWIDHPCTQHSNINGCAVAITVVGEEVVMMMNKPSGFILFMSESDILFCGPIGRYYHGCWCPSC